MPLTQKDILLFRPAFAILGHIHAAIDRTPVYYPGSPCPMDITETGHRRFLIYDSALRNVTPVRVPAEQLYFNETFTVLPLDDDLAHIRDAVEARIKAWGLQDDEVEKVRVRVRVRGYCSDRIALQETLRASLKPFRFYDEQPPDIAAVSSADPERIDLAKRVLERITETDMSDIYCQPDRDDVFLAALKLIYGEQ
jgi:exonuclease SbcD